MNKFNLKGVKADTWIRLIVLLIAFISQLLVLIGKRTEAIDIDTWQEYASYFVTAASAVWSFWKNNSFTQAAQYGDKVKEIAKENGDFEIDASCNMNEESEVDIECP